MATWLVFKFMCCVTRPANGCSANRLQVKIDFLMLKQLFLSLTEQNKQLLGDNQHLRATPMFCYDEQLFT